MSKICILVVDDASFIRDLLKKGLRDNFPGVRIEEAVNGRKAQQVLEHTPIDLVLCDWEMPEMSGLELLAWCRGHERLRTTPFIMVTSRGDKENVIQAIQAGVSDYIGKPFTNDQLVSKVRKAMSRAGKLEALLKGPVRKADDRVAAETLAALTGGASVPARAPEKPLAASPAKAPAPVAATAPVAVAPQAASEMAQLRLPSATLACVVKSLSLKEASLLLKRGTTLPQVLEQAVLDLEQRGSAVEVARLNGYLHAVSAWEAKPDSAWLLVKLRFVDQDPQKLEYLSRLIARGTHQKHYVPGA